MAETTGNEGFDREGSRPLVRPSSVVGALSWTIVALAAVAAGLGLLWNGAEGPATFTTVRGETVTQYARGLYRFDSLFAGAGHKGTDAVTLVIGLPALSARQRRTVADPRAERSCCWGRSRGSSTRTRASLWAAAAYNEAFLLYVVLFAASLFVLAGRSATSPSRARRSSDRSRDSSSSRWRRSGSSRPCCDPYQGQ